MAEPCKPNRKQNIRGLNVHSAFETCLQKLLHFSCGIRIVSQIHGFRCPPKKEEEEGGYGMSTSCDLLTSVQPQANSIQWLYRGPVGVFGVECFGCNAERRQVDERFRCNGNDEVAA